MAGTVTQFEVWLVTLDPTRGSEIRKTRPCAVVSPDAMNRHLRTIIVAPLTSSGKPYPSRVSCSWAGVQGMIVLDQIRTVDRSRLVKPLGTLDVDVQERVREILAEMFE